MKRIYVGQRAGKRTIFLSDSTPTQESHGHLYNAVIGPFRTRRAAEIMRDAHGPQIQSVADAEKAAKLLGNPPLTYNTAVINELRSMGYEKVLTVEADTPEQANKIKDDVRRDMPNYHLIWAPEKKRGYVGIWALKIRHNPACRHPVRDMNYAIKGGAEKAYVFGKCGQCGKLFGPEGARIKNPLDKEERKIVLRRGFAALRRMKSQARRKEDRYADYNAGAAAAYADTAASFSYSPRATRYARKISDSATDRINSRVKNPYSRRARFKHVRLRPPAYFDPRSFRTISVEGTGAEITVGCPKGHYDAGRGVCRVGMKAQRILKPK